MPCIYGPKGIILIGIGGKPSGAKPSVKELHKAGSIN